MRMVLRTSGHHCWTTPSLANTIVNTAYFGTTIEAITGQIKVWLGSWVAKPVKVWLGSWVIKPAKIWNGTAFVETDY